MGNIFRVYDIFQLTTSDNEFYGEREYLPILHETLCDNYFIIKYLMKSNVSRVILLANFIELTKYNLLQFCYKEVEAKTARANLA